MRRGTILLSLSVALALAGRARAGEPPIRPADSPYERKMKFLRGARKGVVLLRTEVGLASGTVLDQKAGLVACAKSSLDSAGRIVAYAFVTEVPERGPDVVRRVDLGEAKIVALHRSADAAILKVALHPDTAEFLPSPRRLSPDTEVRVVGVRGAAAFEEAADLNVRRGRIAETWKPTSPAAGGSIPLTAPTHRNSAGGAVLDADGNLVGIASFSLPKGAMGAAVSLEVFDGLRTGVAAQVPTGEAAEYVRRKKGPPPFWPVSPGSPEGKRVDFGQGAVALKESRAVLATGVFVLDRDEALEYLATPRKRGKLHETVVALDADPAVLYLAFTGLKYNSGGVAQGVRPYGDRLRIYVEWDAAEARAIGEWLSGIDPPWKRPPFRDVLEKVREGAIGWERGAKVRVRAEDLMFNVRDGHPMVRTDWVYTGSGFIKDEETGRHLFRATLDGVLVAVYRDGAAMFNIPLETAADDTYYCTRGCFNPPRGTRCTVIFLPAGEKELPSGRQKKGEERE